MMFSRTTCMLFVLISVCLYATNSIKVSKNTENSELLRVYTADEVHEAEVKAEEARVYYKKCQDDLDAARKAKIKGESDAVYAARVKALNEIAEKAKEGWNKFTVRLTRMKEAVAQNLRNAGNAVAGAVAGAGHAVADAGRAAGRAAVGVLGKLTGAVSNAANRVVAFASAGWARLRAGTKKACEDTLRQFQHLGNLTGEALEHAREGMSRGIESVGNACKKGWDAGKKGALDACNALTATAHAAQAHLDECRRRRAAAKAAEQAALDAQLAKAEIDARNHRLAEEAAKRCYNNVLACVQGCKVPATRTVCENDCAANNLS